MQQSRSRPDSRCTLLHRRGVPLQLLRSHLALRLTHALQAAAARRATSRPPEDVHGSGGDVTHVNGGGPVSTHAPPGELEPVAPAPRDRETAAAAAAGANAGGWTRVLRGVRGRTTRAVPARDACRGARWRGAGAGRRLSPFGGRRAVV